MIALSAEYREKLNSLSFVGTKVPSKVSYDHTDTAVVRTTEKDESNDIHVVVDRPVTPHWKDDAR